MLWTHGIIDVYHQASIPVIEHYNAYGDKYSWSSHNMTPALWVSWSITSVEVNSMATRSGRKWYIITRDSGQDHWSPLPYICVLFANFSHRFRKWTAAVRQAHMKHSVRTLASLYWWYAVQLFDNYLYCSWNLVVGIFWLKPCHAP